MTPIDALWSYAEEFADKILDSNFDGSADSVISEIVEMMSSELNKRDQRKVIEKLESIITFKVSEGEMSKTKWDKIHADLSALLGL